MTAAAAERAGLADRGETVSDYAADMVVFDLTAVPREGTWEGRAPPWLHYVLINGIPVLRDGRFADAKPGHVLQ